MLPVVQAAYVACLWANSQIPHGQPKMTPDDFIPRLGASTQQQKKDSPPMIAGDPVKTSLYLMSMWDGYAANFKK